MKSRFRLVFTGVLLVAVGQASGQDEPARFGLSLGAFITDRETDTRLDSDALGPGTPVDLEDHLGFDASDAVFRVDGYLRFNRRHRIDFSVFDLSRDSEAVIDETIQFGDEVYDVDTTITAESDLTIYKLAYTWSFAARDEGYLGLTGGLYIMDTALGLSEPALGSRESGDVTAPLPVIGLRGEYALTRRWWLRGSAELFVLQYGDFDGSLVDLYAGIDYRFSDRFALSLAYNGVTIDVDSKDASLSGALDWSYQGVLLCLRFDFGSVE